jgi:hypothetical protein
MGRLTEDQLRLAAGTERGPRRARPLHQVTVLADRRAACQDAASDAALSARKIGPGQAVSGQGTGLYMGAGLPQKAEALAVHLVEIATSDPTPGQETEKNLEPAKCLI